MFDSLKMTLFGSLYILHGWTLKLQNIKGQYIQIICNNRRRNNDHVINSYPHLCVATLLSIHPI